MAAHLLTMKDAAVLIGVSMHTVQSWVLRDTDPLPSLIVGKAGIQRRVITAAIEPWLEAESRRTTPTSDRAAAK